MLLSAGPASLSDDLYEECSVTFSMQGLSLTEKWNTDNSLNTTVDYDKLLPGLKLTLDGSFQPNTGAKVEWWSGRPSDRLVCALLCCRFRL